jgi:hypothetical protein
LPEKQVAFPDEDGEMLFLPGFHRKPKFFAANQIEKITFSATGGSFTPARNRRPTKRGE